MNWWGMFFAFLSLILFIGLAALALYLDKQWFAGIFGVASILSVVSLYSLKQAKILPKKRSKTKG